MSKQWMDAIDACSTNALAPGDLQPVQTVQMEIEYLSNLGVKNNDIEAVAD